MGRLEYYFQKIRDRKKDKPAPDKPIKVLDRLGNVIKIIKPDKK